MSDLVVKDVLDELKFEHVLCVYQASYGETHDLRKSLYRERFSYGIGDAAVELSAIVTVWQCLKCDVMWTNEDAAAARDAAVKIHLLELLRGHD